MTLKINQGHQTYIENVDLGKAIVMQHLKDITLTVSKKKSNIKAALQYNQKKKVSSEHGKDI